MNQFADLGLSEVLLDAVTAAGFENPTPVQSRAIPYILEKKGDIIALAQTGTGKTAAFGLPLLQLIARERKNPKALIICPTRELCMQIKKELTTFSQKCRGPEITAVYGGEPIYTQIKELNRGTDILVATPGRLIDLINRKKVYLGDVEYAVLDEADEMLNMGFREDLYEILKSVPDERTNLMFSATMPSDVEKIVKTFMSNPEKIVIGRKNSGADNVTHLYYRVHARDRYNALKRIADSNPDIYGIIFCRTRQETREVSEKLIQDNYSADALHGDLSQAQRDYVMQKFRKKNIQMLVATDVAARGIDIQDLTHVINFNLPDDAENYTHRSGRTGRAGKTGVSISIINMKEQYRIRTIENFTGKKFVYAKVPSGKEVCEIQLKELINRFQNIDVNTEQLAPFMDDIHSKLEPMDRSELIERFLSLEFNRFLSYYEKAPDLNIEKGRDGGRNYEGRYSNRNGGRYSNRESRGKYSNRESSSRYMGSGRTERSRDYQGSREPRRNSRGPEQGYTRLFINLGAKDSVEPRDIISLVKRFSSNRNVNIGKIDIGPAFSFFEVPADSAPSVVSGLKNKSFKDRSINIETANQR